MTRLVTPRIRKSGGALNVGVRLALCLCETWDDGYVAKYVEGHAMTLSGAIHGESVATT